MHLLINGQRHEFSANAASGAMTVADVLEKLNLLGKRIAIERNGEIVPKSLHGETPVAVGDRLEIVVAVGGG